MIKSIWWWNGISVSLNDTSWGCNALCAATEQKQTGCSLGGPHRVNLIWGLCGMPHFHIERPSTSLSFERRRTFGSLLLFPCYYKCISHHKSRARSRKAWRETGDHGALKPALITRVSAVAMTSSLVSWWLCDVMILVCACLARGWEGSFIWEGYFS